MALPDRAYGERQQASPIKISGVVKEVMCVDHHCHVSIQIEAIKRNTSAKVLHPGDVITVRAVSAPSSSGPRPPAGLQAPPIGRPDNAVSIPPLASHTQAWLRPAEATTGAGQTQLYELLAGPFGFGPDLEDQTAP
ncbi:MAG: hypothetical protein VKP70_05750 [Cyanobacteriota bacterium]|nr:hypothetical protein [Cyanobacteriota bacterium]